MNKICIYMKLKINKEVWCTFNDKKVSRELCSICSADNRYNSAEFCRKIHSKSNKKHKLTKATDIPTELKKKVWERDNHMCIFCHKYVRWKYANSHYIKRSHLGMGIEENIFTACTNCHYKFDDSIYRKDMMNFAKNYLISKYEHWNEDMLIYKKYNF